MEYHYQMNLSEGISEEGDEHKAKSQSPSTTRTPERDSDVDESLETFLRLEKDFADSQKMELDMPETIFSGEENSDRNGDTITVQEVFPMNKHNSSRSPSSPFK